MADPGHTDLVRWHGELTRGLEGVVTEDETSPAHAGQGYRPHVTLGWGASGDMSALPDGPGQTILTAFVTAVLLAEYPSTWPEAGVVRPIRQLRLAEATSEGETPDKSF